MRASTCDILVETTRKYDSVSSRSEKDRRSDRKGWHEMILRWAEVNFSAAIHGHFEIIKWMHANQPRNLSVGALCGAVIGGHLEMVGWLGARRSFNDIAFFGMYDRYSFKVKIVSTPMVQLFLSEYKWDSPRLRLQWTDVTLRLALRCGNLDAVKLLWNYQAECSYVDGMHFDRICIMCHAQTCSKAAAIGGHLEIVQWLPETSISQTDFEGIKRSLVLDGHLDVIGFLCESRPVSFDNCIVDALLAGKMEIVRYVYEHSDHSKWVSSQYKIVQYAAQVGHLDVVKWLHDDVGLSSDGVDVTRVVKYGDLDVLKYLKSRSQLKITMNHLALAAENDRFDLLEWLIQEFPAIANQQTLEAYYCST